MLHKILLFLWLLTAGALLAAQTVQVNPDYPDPYTVMQGDTLWDISARFLVEPWRWPEIWQVNPQIDNPHLIYPGDIIRLSFDGDTPVLTVERGQTAGRSVKLSPSVRVNERARAIYTIPIDVIRQFLTRPLIVGENEMEGWPYVVSSFEQHLVASPGIEIYIKGLAPASAARKYSIYRKGPPYISTSRGYSEALGYEALYIGDAEVRNFGDPSTAVVSSAVKEVMIGDRLVLQSDDEMFNRFVPSAPDSSITGSIISAEGVLTEIGQYQVVVLDRGAADGVEIGNVFGVFQSGVMVSDKVKSSEKDYENTDLIDYLGKSKSRGLSVTLPDVHAGVLMVFRTFDRVSYGLVMEALIPIHLNDRIKSM
jgi:hypothetical protein